MTNFWHTLKKLWKTKILIPWDSLANNGYVRWATSDTWVGYGKLSANMLERVHKPDINLLRKENEIR